MKNVCVQQKETPARAKERTGRCKHWDRESSSELKLKSFLVFADICATASLLQ